MTNSIVRVTTNAMDMPLLYRDAARSVILPGVDQVRYYGRGADSPDWNQPQLLYGENIMPLSRGIISTTTEQLVPPSTYADFDQAVIVRDKNENQAIVVTAKGKNYLLNNTTWAPTVTFTPSAALITRAYTQGRSFVYYEAQKLLEYTGTTMTDVTSSLVLPTGYSVTDIRGIGAASNYLLLFTSIDLLWSAPDDPLNFNRALNNGSGYQIPQDLRGRITCILPVSGGAIIYSVRNAVSAVFTNNAQTPFLFRGISNAGGVASYEQVAYDADERFQYVWGSGGLQAVTLQSAEPVFPEIADFLTSRYFEYFDYTSNRVVGVPLSTFLQVKLTYVGQRFLVISYGRLVGQFEYALIYDTSLKRLGKVKVDHVDCLTYPYPSLNGNPSYVQAPYSYTSVGDATYTTIAVGVIPTLMPRRTIAFLKSNGQIDILSFDYSRKTAKGVAIFGSMQFVRDRYVTLHNIECEGLDQVSGGTVYAHCSENGKDVDRVVQFQSYDTPSSTWQQFKGRETAKAINIAIVAAFQLTGLLAKLSKHGKT